MVSSYLSSDTHSFKDNANIFKPKQKFFLVPVSLQNIKCCSSPEEASSEFSLTGPLVSVYSSYKHKQLWAYALYFFPPAQTSPGCFTFHHEHYHNKSFIFVWNVVHVQSLCNPRRLQHCPAQPQRTSHRSSSPLRNVATSTFTTLGHMITAGLTFTWHVI